MKKNHIIVYIFVAIIFNFVFADNSLEEIQQAINSKNANWTAKENEISRMSREEFRRMCGTYTDYKPIDGEERLIELPQVENMPESFDWRENNGVTSVKRQLSCGSCWDFSGVAQIESWWKIYYDYPDSNIDLSEQYILSCASDVGGCDGGWAYQVLEYVTNNSIPHEKYMEYKADDTVPCDSLKSGWESSAVTIPGWGYITLDEANVINIKNALLHHPVSASFIVYSDFSYYSSGVYEYTSGEYEAGHAILIVGWEDENECWICKNSWGSGWGENGYFRIKWGECNIGKNMAFIYDEMAENIDITLSQESVNINLLPEEETSTTLSISNSGSSTVELYTTDSQNPILFHQSTNSALSGQSWWCGTDESGGYENYWLQYLETPAIDLSGCTNPQLDFMAKWAVEPAAGASSPYDGWDGWNIWISTDGGDNFTVLEPTSPSYTNSSLWSFGHDEQGWEMGAGIAGYSGYSNQWEAVNCDLSTYIGENVKLRFAFASDMGYSTSDDETLEGLFLDNIFVSDGENIIFADSANFDSQMELLGYGDLENDWLDLYYDDNQLAPGESMDLKLNIVAPEESGEYSSEINFLANNSDVELPTIDVNMIVEQNESDISIDDIILPTSEVIGTLNYPVGIVVSNNGKNDANNIVVSVADGLYQGKISSLDAGNTKILWIAGYDFTDVGEFEVTATTDYADNQMTNNSLTETLYTGNLLDDFEHFNSNWELNQWSYSNSEAEDGLYCLSCASETGSSELKFNKSFNLEDAALLVKFSAKVLSGNASLKLEYKYGNEDWVTKDNFTIDTTDYMDFESNITAVSDDSVLIRFVATPSKNATIFLDNIEVEGLSSEDVDDEEIAAETFQLQQNYPNPFNPSTFIEYSIPERCDVKLSIYDISGNLVETLVNDSKPLGKYKVQWNAGNNASGIYFYRLQAGNFTKTSKMILMK